MLTEGQTILLAEANSADVELVREAPELRPFRSEFQGARYFCTGVCRGLVLLVLLNEC